MHTKISLEQWNTLIAIVEQGGYRAAAEHLDKSQSTLSYSISRLEDELGVRVFSLQGRKAALTTAGRALYQRAIGLVEEAKLMENLADSYREGAQISISIAKDSLFPSDIVLRALEVFYQQHPSTHIEWFDTVLTGTQDAILKHQRDLVLTGHVPQGVSGTPLFKVKMIAVAHPSHPLNQCDCVIQDHQLSHHRQIVIRDSGAERADIGWLQSHKRITVSDFKTCFELIKCGVGFSWVPEYMLSEAQAKGEAKAVTFEAERSHQVPMYLVNTRGRKALPLVTALADILVLESQS